MYDENALVNMLKQETTCKQIEQLISFDRFKSYKLV